MGWELLFLRTQQRGKELKPLRYGHCHTSEPGGGNGGNWHLSDPFERGSGNWHPHTLKKRWELASTLKEMMEIGINRWDLASTLKEKMGTGIHEEELTASGIRRGYETGITQISTLIWSNLERIMIQDLSGTLCTLCRNSGKKIVGGGGRGRDNRNQI